MKKNIYSLLTNTLGLKSFLLASAGFVLASCSTQMNGYTETDGVYYNPETDVIPEAVVARQGNGIDEVYDYNEAGIIEQSKRNEELKNDRYNTWTQRDDSDWGVYAGSEVEFNSGWDYPYGLFSPFGMNRYSFYSPYGFYGYSPFYDFMFPSFGMYYGYNPYYYGYSPYNYYGYNPYGYYGNPYYGNPYYYAQPYRYKRSGSEGLRTSPAGSSRNMPYGNDRSGTGIYRQAPVQNSAPRNYRTQPRTETQRYEAPRIRTENSNDGGFRSNTSGDNNTSTSSGRRSGGGFR